MIRRFLKYAGVFALTLAVCAGLLTGVCALIPQSAILPSMQRAESYFSAQEGFPLLWDGQPATRMDNYADCALFDVIYHVDSQNPLYSVVAAPYYRNDGRDIRLDFYDAVVGGQPANNEYSRYWHGSQVLLRPLLTFLSIQGCRLALFGLLLALLVWLAVRLVRMRRVRVLVILLIGLLAVHFWMAAFTIEYITTFLVMAAACVAVTGLWSGQRTLQKRVQGMTALCIVSGTGACFVDFLTTETLTLTVPVLVWLMLCHEDGVPMRFRQVLLWLVRFGAAWMMAYGMTFAVKWALVYVVMGREALMNVFSSAAYRIDRVATEDAARTDLTVRSVLLPMMLGRNIGLLLPFADGLTTGAALGWAGGMLAALGAVFYLFRGKKLDGAFLCGLLLVGLIPYARLLGLASHSLDHYFFTYRAQMAFVMAVAAVLAYGVKPSDVLGKKRKR